MCQLIFKFSSAIEARFKEDCRLDKPICFKIEKTEQCTIGTVNIYFKDEAIFQELANYAEEFLIKVAREAGEIQIIDIQNGKNIDLGIEQARILNGKFFEFYCYHCFSITFIRILLEEGIYYKQRWISIDLDEILNTPWFKD
ncbi:MAG: hypothetical protein QXJ68_05055 [Methanocellales archaeon]